MDCWQEDARQVLKELKTSKRGLTEKEARSRLLKFGKNEFDIERHRTTLRIFLSQFESPLVLILLGASVISGFLGDVTATVIIVAIILFSAALAFYQEYRSEQALNDLRRRVSLSATVIRNGKTRQVSASDLVVGDIVALGPGKVVPADARLVESKGLNVDEAVLTGESFPVEKTIKRISVKRKCVQEMSNLVFMGTHVAQGSGLCVVIAVGKATELGRTARLLEKTEGESEFQKGIRTFGYLLVKVILLFTAAIFLFLAVMRGDWIGSLLFSLAVAVGISPELLPVIITINLSRGAKKMARREVIVKRLMSIEDLGNADVLCTDKTGTLTEGTIALRNAQDLSRRESRRLLKLGWLCNAMTIDSRIAGNPLDEAILNAGRAAGIAAEARGAKIVGSVPFDFVRRRMSVVVEEAGKRMLICKGATEEMLSVCKQPRPWPGYGRGPRRYVELRRTFDELHKQGFRLLLVGTKPVERRSVYQASDETDLTLVGYLVFMDMPKQTAKDTLPRLRKLGVDVKILTGDNEMAAEFVCREIGFEVKGVLLGSDLENLDTLAFARAVESANIFAKITPEQKVDIVNALRAKGHTVGFLGDGINDAAALRAADVGVSVDSAVDVAKEAADVVLLRKSLDVLTDGIVEGRKTFGNTLKYIFSTISSNFGNMFSVAGAAAFLPFIPMLPTQVLLLNFFSDLPMVAISTDKVDDDYLRKPKHWDIRRIRNVMCRFGLISSVFDYITFGVLAFIFHANQSLFQTGWFWESFLTEVVIVFILRTRKRFWKSSPSHGLVITTLITTLLVLIVLYTPIGAFFRFTPPPPSVLFTIILITAAYFAVTELAKKRMYRRFNV